MTKSAPAAVVTRYQKRPSGRNVGRTPIPETPKVAELVKDYKGGQAIASGETFNPTPANIEARVKRLTLPSGMKVALLPKKTRGETVVGQISLHFGNEKSLQGMHVASEMMGTLMKRGTEKYTRQQIVEKRKSPKYAQVEWDYHCRLAERLDPGFAD